MKASKQQIKDWLDVQIGLNKAASQSLVLTTKKDIFSDDEEIVPDVKLQNISVANYIHLNDGSLRLVANALELPITVSDRGENYDKFARYELSFIYNGMKFLTLESESEYAERGELA